MKPGLYPDIPETIYHADPCTVPSLSSSVAATIVEKSLAHARLHHPKFTEQPERKPTREMEIGTATHALLLGRGRDVAEIFANDYKGGAAQNARKAAYREGLAPILKPDLATAKALAAAAIEQMALVPECAGFADALPEMTAIVEDRSGAWLRARFDKFEDHGDHAVIWDVKTGGSPAAPHKLGDRFDKMSYEIQAAFYERALLHLRPELYGRLKFRWLFIENEAPHLIQVGELDAGGLTIGRRKVAAAIGLWNRAMQSGEWPGYPPEMVTIEYPIWAETRWLNREMTDDDLSSLIATDPFLCHALALPSRDTSMTEITS